MNVQTMDIPEVKLLTPQQFGDERGFFSEVYNRRQLLQFGIDIEFVQDNQSLSRDKGTLRGLHFQTPPFAQDKLVRVTRGAILDVAVDLRRESPTFAQHVSAVISAKEWNQILVPVGFAHGFCTLEPDTEVLYKVSNYYSPEHDRGVLWNDPDLAIDWPVNVDEVILSAKDQAQPRLAEMKELF